MRKPYNTPHRTHVVKTRLTDEEHELFLNQCRTYGISQSEMLRQSMTRLQIKPVIHVSAVNDELLSAIGKLTAEYGRAYLNGEQLPDIAPLSGITYRGHFQSVQIKLYLSLCVAAFLLMWFMVADTLLKNKYAGCIKESKPL